MPSRATGLGLAALMLAVALAGCTAPPQPDDGPSVRTGDFLEVAYVLSDGDGNLLESTLEDPASPGDPPGIDDPSAPGHDPVWWYVFDRDHARSEPGLDKQVGVVFRDRFPTDGRNSLAVRGFADVAANGSTSNRSSSLWSVPADVDELAEPTLVTGLHERLLDAHGGEVVDLEIPPDEAHGEYDPAKAQELPVVVDEQTRQVGPVRRAEIGPAVNLTENTTEGDIVDYRILANNWVNASVEQIDETNVTLFLMIDNGTLLPRDGLWPGRIVDVNATHFGIEQVVEVGETYTIRSRQGRITDKTDGTFTLDFNDPRAGKTLHYTIAIQRVLPHDRDRHLRGEETEPFDGQPLHDLAWGDEFTLLAASGSGVHLVFPPRVPWYGFSRQTTGEAATALAIGPGGGDLWVADGRLRASTDGGLTWSATGDSPSGIVDLAAAGEDRVHALTDDGTLHASDDGGATWEAAGTVGAAGQGLAVDPDDPTVLYAATDDGLMRSGDGGATWERLAFANTSIADVAAGSDRLYAIANGTPMRSTDGGTEWTEATPDPRPYAEIATLADEDRWVSVGASGGRVGISQDGGRSWRLVE